MRERVGVISVNKETHKEIKKREKGSRDNICEKKRKKREGDYI